jgi:hypothetical protein
MADMPWIASSSAPWVAIAALVAILVLVLVGAFRYGARRTELFRDAWRAFAATRGFRWTQSTGPWYRRRPDAIEGSVQGVPFRLDTYVVSTGKSQTTFTRATSPLERPVAARLTISPRSFFTTIGERFGMETLRTGDAGFDAKMSVRSKAPREALALVDETVRSRLLALDRRASVVVDGKEAKVRWRGAEKDPTVLDAACEVVSAIARASARA